MLAPMSEELAGKSGIVTGGARGIGEAIATAFAAAGARVAVFDQDGAGAKATAATLGPEALAFEVDVTDEDAVGAAVGEVADAYGRIDFLVNNAGVRHTAPLADHPVDVWRRTIEINVVGTFICSQAAIRVMRGHGGGRILNLGSMAGELALGERSAYNASKGAVEALTKSIAVDHGEEGIFCNSIAPGVIETPLSAPYFEDEGMVAILRENSPIGRWGQVAEVAAPAVFLCSDAASFIQGETLFVDGGWTAGKGY
jgi:NAD(P)-dependent dehydrogenase (short-subunit alcohol dehydrogenase family)